MSQKQIISLSAPRWNCKSEENQSKLLENTESPPQSFLKFQLMQCDYTRVTELAEKTNSSAKRIQYAYKQSCNLLHYLKVYITPKHKHIIVYKTLVVK